jgi:hypothetical protein
MAAPAWYKGPGVYHATEIDPEEYSMDAEHTDPAPENRLFVLLNSFGGINWPKLIRLREKDARSKFTSDCILEADKVENPNYYEFITGGADEDGGSYGLGDWYLVSRAVLHNPPEDLTIGDLGKIGAMVDWLTANYARLPKSWTVDEKPELELACRRYVELATTESLRVRALRALREHRETIDVVAISRSLPGRQLRQDFDDLLAVDEVFHASR